LCDVFLTSTEQCRCWCIAWWGRYGCRYRYVTTTAKCSNRRTESSSVWLVHCFWKTNVTQDKTSSCMFRTHTDMRMGPWNPWPTVFITRRWCHGFAVCHELAHMYSFICFVDSGYTYCMPTDFV